MFARGFLVMSRDALSYMRAVAARCTPKETKGGGDFTSTRAGPGALSFGLCALVCTRRRSNKQGQQSGRTRVRLRLPAVVKTSIKVFYLILR